MPSAPALLSATVPPENVGHPDLSRLAPEGLGDKAKGVGGEAAKGAVQSVLGKAVESVNSEIDELSGPTQEEKQHMKKGVDLLMTRVQEGIEQNLGT